MDLAPEQIAATTRAEVARQRITQDAIGVAINRNQRAVSRRLTGHVQFTVGELEAIAKLLGMSLEELLALARRDAAQAESA